MVDDLLCVRADAMAYVRIRPWSVIRRIVQSAYRPHLCTRLCSDIDVGSAMKSMDVAWYLCQL